MIRLALLILFTLHAAPSTAGTIILSKRNEHQSFQNQKVLSASFIEYKKRLDISGDPARYATWFTDTRFAYSVQNPSLIEDYAIVQWIRGCMFHSRMENGNVERTFTIYRRHFGIDKPFVHKDWEIDSDVTDPIYTVDERYGRHALLRWNKDSKSSNPETATFYAKAKPPHGTVFATDLPGPAGLSNGDGKTDGSAQNASLEFRTCLFETNTLPKTTDPKGKDIDPSKALWCVNWNHRLVWDFSKGKMTEPSSIDPACSTAGTE